MLYLYILRLRTRISYEEWTQSLEAIHMLPVTPTFLVMSHVAHFSSVALKPALALIYPNYCFFAAFREQVS